MTKESAILEGTQESAFGSAVECPKLKVKQIWKFFT